MARRLRIERGGIAYHVLNRRVGRLPLLQRDEDYAALEGVADEAHARSPMHVIAYCLMSDHLALPRKK